MLERKSRKRKIGQAIATLIAIVTIEFSSIVTTICQSNGCSAAVAIITLKYSVAGKASAECPITFLIATNVKHDARELTKTDELGHA